MLGFPGDPPTYFGSAFFVANMRAVDAYDRSGGPVPFLVTARHNIANAIHEERALCIRLSRRNGGSVDYILPNDGWLFPDEADIAALPLPHLRAQPEGDLIIVPIARDQFFVADWQLSLFDFRLGDRVRIVGLWYGDTTHPQLIVRSGNIATATTGPIQTPSGAIPSYLIDASVTRAMSGGPAYATRGAGWAESALIGVNFGFWPANADAFASSIVGVETTENRLRRLLLEEVERLNSQLAIITPVHHLAELLLSSPLWNQNA